MYPNDDNKGKTCHWDIRVVNAGGFAVNLKDMHVQSANIWALVYL